MAGKIQISFVLDTMLAKFSGESSLSLKGILSESSLELYCHGASFSESLSDLYYFDWEVSGL